MNRRQFVAGIGGSAAWPLGARAQRAVQVIGLLSAAIAAETFPQFRTAFRRGLGEQGIYSRRKYRDIGA